MEQNLDYRNQDDTDKVKFENNNCFDIMIIKPNNIESLDYNNPGYVTKLVGESFNVIEKISPENFLENLAKNLRVDEFEGEDRNIVTQVFYDKPEYFYEMMFLDVRTKNLKNSENENQFGSMLNKEGEKIFGNVIIMKTYIPNDKESSMIFSDISRDDLFEILDSRANSKVVIFQDGEFREEKVRGDMDIYCKHLFQEDYFQKKELNFFHHNLNIWYLKDDDYGTELSKKLVPNKVECAVFFSMISEKYRGNITLDEVKKIVELSKSLENFNLRKEWVEEEKDELNRRIIKNKYRVLDYAWKEHLKKNL